MSAFNELAQRHFQGYRGYSFEQAGLKASPRIGSPIPWAYLIASKPDSEIPALKVDSPIIQTRIEDQQYLDCTAQKFSELMRMWIDVALTNPLAVPRERRLEQ